MDERRLRNPGAAFLIAQLGGHSARLWVARLAKEDLDAREVMLFRHVALNEGRSQREVASAIGLPASRIVSLVNRLEARGWLERRPGTTDRRTNALHLTRKGRTALARVMSLSTAHEVELTRALPASDREVFIRLLDRVAADQGLIEGVHPGFGDRSADQTQD
jgi:DNA-binding MarR family transcriptional regulator